jgi:hypothetical protein
VNRLALLCLMRRGARMPPTNRIEGVTLKGGRVVLDGNHYVDCRFEDVTIVFAATAPTALERCAFVRVQWTFEGPAAHTMEFLNALYHGAGEGGRKLVERTFDIIRQSPRLGAPPTPAPAAQPAGS